MIALSSVLTFELYLPPTDMRKSFDSLRGLILQELGQSPSDGTVYIFINKAAIRSNCSTGNPVALSCITNVWNREILRFPNTIRLSGAHPELHPIGDAFGWGIHNQHNP